MAFLTRWNWIINNCTHRLMFCYFTSILYTKDATHTVESFDSFGYCFFWLSFLFGYWFFLVIDSFRYWLLWLLIPLAVDSLSCSYFWLLILLAADSLENSSNSSSKKGVPFYFCIAFSLSHREVDQDGIISIISF